MFNRLYEFVDQSFDNEVEIDCPNLWSYFGAVVAETYPCKEDESRDLLEICNLFVKLGPEASKNVAKRFIQEFVEVEHRRFQNLQ